MHRARRPTRSESLRGITVYLAVSGRAFCAVTTLPPPEQAAVESREQLAGHQATAGLFAMKEWIEQSPDSSSRSPLPPTIYAECSTVSLLGR